MTSNTPQADLPPSQLPGWYPQKTEDGEHSNEIRYWDGRDWTGEVATVGQPEMREVERAGVSRTLVVTISAVLIAAGVAGASLGIWQVNQARTLDDSTATIQEETTQLQEQIRVLDEE